MGYNYYDNYQIYDDTRLPSFYNDDMADLVKSHPEEVAELLRSFGYQYHGLRDDIDNMSQRRSRSYRWP